MKCSREMAQKYGQPGIQYGTKPNYRIIPYTHWAVIDQCVAKTREDANGSVKKGGDLIAAAFGAAAWPTMTRGEH